MLDIYDGKLPLTLTKPTRSIRRNAVLRLREDREDRRLAAISIAIAACVLRTCPDHELMVFCVEDPDIRDAYKLGLKMFKAGQLKKFFTSRRQMMECIKAAVVEHRVTRCPLCETASPH